MYYGIIIAFKGKAGLVNKETPLMNQFQVYNFR